MGNIKDRHIRQLVATYTADRDARGSSQEYYPDLHKVNTKRDAFRHTVWQALLCKYYWTISSKKKKHDFAKNIGDWNEDCGGNAVGTRHMDYHNNEIGRSLYLKHSSYKKFLGAIVGIRNPTNATLYSETFKQIENNSVFIDAKSFAGTIDDREEKAYLEIIKVSKEKSIYLSKELRDGGFYN